MPTPHHSAPDPPPVSKWQEIRNTSWPAPEVARRLQDRSGIDVTVRIEWERDGEEWIDGQATRWTADHVFVRFSDPRAQLPFAWVVAGDVRRR